MDIINTMLKKIIYAFINTFPQKTNNIKKITPFSSKETIALLVDYDLFSTRTTKKVGSSSYACGLASLDIVQKYCTDNNIDYIRLVTTDLKEKAQKKIEINSLNHIINLGTDISALMAAIDIIEEYENIIFINSSCAISDSEKIGLLNNFKKSHPFIVGFNGNSRISPRSPISLFNKNPHIITNFFKASTKEVIEILKTKRSIYKIISPKLFGCKFYSIRFFETLLSKHIIKNGGDLFLINNKKIIKYTQSPEDWPSTDSRISRFI